VKAILAAALLLAGCASTETFEPTTGPGPEWSFVDTSGTTHSRDTAAGKPAVVFFMATWCVKCQGTAPTLTELAKSRDVRMYTVSWDPQEDEADLARWMDKYGHAWPHGVDPGSKTAQTFQINAQSSLVVLDPSGNLVQRWIYANPSLESLQAAVDEAASRRA
jgi:thiol-disulfide isomerase/thioredoxin